MMTKRMILKRVFICISLVSIFNIFAYQASLNAHASTSNISASATINPSSTITLSSQSVSLDIVPSENGTFDDGYLTVSTYTNTTDNCRVSMTTSSTSLTSGGNTIASLSSAASAAGFTNDRWGYRAGSTGDFSPVTTDNPITSYTINTGSTAQTTDVYFAAKLTAATKPGTYTNTVVFTSTCAPVRDYMQDQTDASLALLMPNDGDSVTLYDERDESDYEVTRINDQYWMTQNLRITGTVSSALSNFTGNSFNVSEYSLDENDNSYAGHCDSGYDDNLGEYVNHGDTNACAKDSGDTTLGVWYNYYSATAGTFDADDEENYLGVVTSDICPAGWRLPTNYYEDEVNDVLTLAGGDESNFYYKGDELPEELIAFSPVTGGYYSSGGLLDDNYFVSAWWTNPASGYALYYDDGSLDYEGLENFNYYNDWFIDTGTYGYYIRCVKGN